jgi:hypothetical protein
MATHRKATPIELAEGSRAQPHRLDHFGLSTGYRSQKQIPGG